MNRTRTYFATALLIAGIAACNVNYWLPPLVAPADAMPAIGGIADTRPMFGKSFGPDGSEISDLLVATCGCGDWRVLIQDRDGIQRQAAITFYTVGDYSPDGEVSFYGTENGLTVAGMVDQATGEADGELDVDIFRREISAVRRETHTNDIEACIKCHIGNDPIYPQPPTHPTYVSGVTNCFDCHEVIIN